MSLIGLELSYLSANLTAFLYFFLNFSFSFFLSILANINSKIKEINIRVAVINKSVKIKYFQILGISTLSPSSPPIPRIVAKKVKCKVNKEVVQNK